MKSEFQNALEPELKRIRQLMRAETLSNKPLTEKLERMRKLSEAFTALKQVISAYKRGM